MTGDPAEIIVERLDAIIRLLALDLGEGKTQREMIKILSVAGLAPKEIAEILGTTPNTVRVARSSMRNRRQPAAQS